MARVRESIGQIRDFASLNRELAALVREYGHAINEFLSEWVFTDFPEITGDQNNFDLGDARGGRFSTDASHNITGFRMGLLGRIFPFINDGGQDLVLVHNSVLSTAANRILTKTGVNVTYPGGSTGFIFYDWTEQKWRSLV